MPTFNTQSPRWAIFDTIATALASNPALSGVTVIRNPTTALTVPESGQVLVVRWQADSLQSASGNREKRQFRLIVGSIARTDREADALHQAASATVRAAIVALNQAGKQIRPEEQEVTPDTDNLLVEGALVLSVWAVDYERPRQ